MSETSIPPIPAKKLPVRELLIMAGLDVSDWSLTKDGGKIANPNDNIGRNTNWSFIGKEGEPIVLCVWYEMIDWDANPPEYRGNEYTFERRLIELAGTQKGKDGLGRLNAKIKQARQFHNTVFDAKRDSREVKLILVAGEQVPIGEAAKRSSIVKARGIDLASWFVHECDGVTGNFLILRGKQPVFDTADPFADVIDPAEDPHFHSYVAELSETEREAQIKTRVGQGPFRESLIERWKTCSITGCGITEILIASHIKPWSRCATRAERLGPANGLLLVPNLDKLFDKGLISFDDNLCIVYSPELKDGFAQMLNVNRNMRIRNVSHTDMLPYLAWHREHILRK